jgi:hypothetical protein
MKATFRALAVAAAMALPMSMQAQSPIDPTVQVNITSGPRLITVTTGGTYNNRTGGGFLANFVVNFSTTATATLNNWLVWCIDPFRSTAIPSSNVYALYSLSDFALTNFGSGSNNPDQADMNAIASQTTLLEDSWGTLDDSQKQAAQNTIWTRFDTVNGMGGDEAFDGSDWYVLWNGQNQSFLTRIPERSIVPEPSAIAMVGFGLVSLMAVRRRRSA